MGAFKLNNAVATAGTWHFKGHTQKVKMAVVYLDLTSKRIPDLI